jgi:hypothetical protein
MKAIEVKKGDKVVFEDLIWIVQGKSLNAVILTDEKGQQRIVSYSQIEKYEQE